MKGNSGIGKEWYEQAKALTEYVAGKTAAEITAIALDAEGRPTGDDLKSSVTVHINDQVALYAAAAASAK